MLPSFQLTASYWHKNESFEHAPTIDQGRSIPISSTIRVACSLCNVFILKVTNVQRSQLLKIIHFLAKNLLAFSLCKVHQWHKPKISSNYARLSEDVNFDQKIQFFKQNGSGLFGLYEGQTSQLHGFMF